MKTITFFNNKGGVGKTSLVYHLAWMFAEMGKKVLTIDLDPQSNLTSAFLPEDIVEQMWDSDKKEKTILGAVQPLLDRLGDFSEPYTVRISDKISHIAGDLGLTQFEDRLATTWGLCLDDNQSNRSDAFRVTTSFFRIMLSAAEKMAADVVLIDVGPNLGSINRAALVATDHIVVPLAADLFSIHGLRNLGPTLKDWRSGWNNRRDKSTLPSRETPRGEMLPVGYVVMQPSVRERYPVQAYRRWTSRIPREYAQYIVGEKVPHLANKYELATLKNYRSLAPLAQDARKPMFFLKAADGAIGGHAEAVRKCYGDFERLAERIATASGLSI